MINLIKKVMQKLNGGQAQYEWLLANAENEYLAMCCSSVNPQSGRSDCGGSGKPLSDNLHKKLSFIDSKLM